VLYPFDVGPDGADVDKVLRDLRGFADLGFQAAIGMVRDVWTVKPLETMGRRVIPEVANW
jgi:hypothetical protein